MHKRSFFLVASASLAVACNAVLGLDPVTLDTDDADGNGGSDGNSGGTANVNGGRGGSSGRGGSVGMGGGSGSTTNAGSGGTSDGGSGTSQGGTITGRGGNTSDAGSDDGGTSSGGAPEGGQSSGGTSGGGVAGGTTTGGALTGGGGARATGGSTPAGGTISSGGAKSASGGTITSGGKTSGGATSSGGKATSGGATSGGATSGGATSGGATSGGATSGGVTGSGGAPPDLTNVAKNLHGVVILAACGANTGPEICQTTRPPQTCASDLDVFKDGVSLANTSVTIGGTVGTSYTINLRFQGIVENRTYIGGQDQGAAVTHGFYVGGAPESLGDYNVYAIRATSPKQDYFLNAVGNVGFMRHQVFVVDYTGSITVTGGSTVTLVAQDPNCSQIKNCTDPADNNSCTSTGVANLDPLIAAQVGGNGSTYNGQFLGLLVTSVTSP